MPYLFICQDSEDSQTLRKAHTQAHLDYISERVEKILVAGPMASEISDQYDGSCFIYKTDDIAEAKELFHSDPYYAGGVYKEYSIHRFLPAAGTWIGGTIW